MAKAMAASESGEAAKAWHRKAAASSAAVVSVAMNNANIENGVKNNGVAINKENIGINESSIMAKRRHENENNIGVVSSEMA